MSVKITDLTAEIQNSGVLRSNLYGVRIQFPAVLGFGNMVSPRIDRVTLPSRQIRGVMQKSSYSELRMIPTAYQNLEDLSMSIILSTDMRERKMMLAWQNAIFNRDGVPSYIDDIAGKIIVTTHGTVNGKEPDERNMVSHRFDQAFPMMVSDMELSAADEEAARLTVIFQYRIWTSQHSNQAPFAVLGLVELDTI